MLASGSASRPAMLIPLIVACALFMENLDSSVLATALPSIAASLGESPLKLNLAITSYLFSLAVFIPVSGWVADRFGARVVFRAAIIVFTLGSLLSGLADSFWTLVGARVLLMGGFFRSLQFTSSNTLTIADIPNDRMSHATSFTSMMQQLSLSAGVAVGAMVLHVTVSAGGGLAQIRADSFAPAFLTVGAIATLSAIVFLRLPADAGAEVSGHRVVAPTQRLSQGTPARPGETGPR